MKQIDISYGEYASKWGIADFYPESEKKLRAALDSGEEFDTGLFGCKKEINYGRIVKVSTGISITVTAVMDDLYEQGDLIYDALAEVSGSDDELPDDVMDSIRECAFDRCLSAETTYEELLFPTAGFDSICKKLTELEEAAMKNNQECFKILCGIVADHLEHQKEAET